MRMYPLEMSSPTSIESDMEPLYSDSGGRHQRRQMKNFLAWTFLGLTCVIVIVAVIITAARFSHPEGSNRYLRGHVPLTNTSCGYVFGSLEEEVFVFRGIPYAMPPIGTRRWQHGVPLHTAHMCWRGTLKAHAFGDQCVQMDPVTNVVSGSENCLFLNVWTPTMDDKANLEVLVFIHGGHFLYGSGNEADVTPTAMLTKYSNKVYVTFNYRLNAFGFLTLDLLSWKDNRGRSGNYGLTDQILALQWVQNNIKQFGGDPNKVTLIGLGSGGTSVFIHLASPASAGLFHRAWALSGSAVFPNRSQQQVQHDLLVFLNNTGCNNMVDTQASLDCLRTLTPHSVINCAPWDMYPNWRPLYLYGLPTLGEKHGALPTVDGMVLRKPPLDSWAAGIINDVPLLVGNTAQEVDDLPFVRSLNSWSWQQYDNYVNQHLDTFRPNISEQVLWMYPHIKSPEYQLTSMVSDLRLICPTNTLVRQATQHFKSPIYRYVVTSSPVHLHKGTGSGRGKKYAHYGWDLQAFLGNIPNFMSDPNRSDFEFERTFIKAVNDFLEDGEIKKWPKAQNGTAIISDRLDFVSEYKTRQCQFWKDNGFYPEYAQT